MESSSDLSGNLYIANASHRRIRKVDAVTGIISTVAGDGGINYCGDSIPAVTACVSPSGVAPDGSGNLFIADQGNHRIRKVDALTGIISTVAGTGTFGFNGDGISATVLVESPHCRDTGWLRKSFLLLILPTIVFVK